MSNFLCERYSEESILVLGTLDYIFPGASHHRFEHSLGTHIYIYIYIYIYIHARDHNNVCVVVVCRRSMSQFSLDKTMSYFLPVAISLVPQIRDRTNETSILTGEPGIFPCYVLIRIIRLERWTKHQSIDRVLLNFKYWYNDTDI